jgi:flagellar hook assembly protein FlgD
VLSVHDTRGRLVALLEDTILGGGSHAFLWDGRDGEGREVPSGAYFARVLAAGEERTMKLLLIR